MIQDKADRENDLKLAQHIGYVHQHNKNPPLQFEPIPLNLMRKYLNAARSVKPIVPDELSETLTMAYVTLREEARNNKNSTFTSARTLLSIIRLSTGLAKLRLADEVIKEDIDEALRLIEMSKDTLAGNEEDDQRIRQRPMDRIYQTIIELMNKQKDQRQAKVSKDIFICYLTIKTLN